MIGLTLNLQLHPPSSGIPGQTLLLPTLSLLLLHPRPTRVTTMPISHRHGTLGQIPLLPLRHSPFHLTGATMVSIVHLPLAV